MTADTVIRTIHIFVLFVATLATIACVAVGDWMPAIMFAVLVWYAGYRLKAMP